jgi:hypothetical protein
MSDANLTRKASDILQQPGDLRLFPARLKIDKDNRCPGMAKAAQIAGPRFAHWNVEREVKRQGSKRKSNKPPSWGFLSLGLAVGADLQAGSALPLLASRLELIG